MLLTEFKTLKWHIYPHAYMPYCKFSLLCIRTDTLVEQLSHCDGDDDECVSCVCFTGGWHAPLCC